MAFPPLNLGLAGKRADGLQLAAAYAFRLGAHFNVSGNVRKFCDSKPIFLDWLMVSPFPVFCLAEVRRVDCIRGRFTLRGAD